MTKTQVVLQGLFYAAMTVTLLIGVALLLSQGTIRARDAAYEEIQAHRYQSLCYQSTITDALNQLLAAHELQQVETIDLSGIDCVRRAPVHSAEPSN